MLPSYALKPLLCIDVCGAFVSRMITLKVLNSIVLLGTSCTFVKEAKMEEKLFDPPPSVSSSRANSRANRTKTTQASGQQGNTAALLYTQTHTCRCVTRVDVESITLFVQPWSF